jgi:transposase-like protein
MDQVSPFAGRRRRSRSEALRLAFEYEQSGLTRQAFCQLHGLSPASLDNYRRLRNKQLGAKQSAIADLDLVPVELIDCVSSSQPQGSDAGIFLVLTKGRRISITTGFDAATLVRLVAVLDEA